MAPPPTPPRLRTIPRNSRIGFSLISHGGYVRAGRLTSHKYKVGPPSSYKWGYGAPINGLKFSWGPLGGYLIEPYFLDLSGPHLVCMDSQTVHRQNPAPVSMVEKIQENSRSFSWLKTKSKASRGRGLPEKLKIRGEQVLLVLSNEFRDVHLQYPMTDPCMVYLPTLIPSKSTIHF